MTNKYAKVKKGGAKVQRMRHLIIGGIAGAVVLVAAYGLLYTDPKAETGYLEGKDYTLIEPRTRRRPNSPITVIEYFSYACIHCKNFDPSLNAWSEALPGDVQLKRLPVAFSPAWELLAKAFLSFQSLDIVEENHSRMFSAVHDQRRQFLSAEMIADYVDGHGVNKAEFLATFNSTAVQRNFEKISRRARAIPVSGVPMLVVADKYVLPSSLDRKGMLALVDYLLDKERTEAIETRTNPDSG